MREVAVHFRVSIDAVTYVLRKLKIPRRSAYEAGKIAFESKPLSFQILRPKNSKQRTLEIMGAMLYWAEGYKTKLAAGIDFANSDPRMALTFMNFLRSRYILDEKRLKILLYCYADQNTDRLITFWSDRLSLPRTQFTRPYVRKDYRPDRRKMPYGLVHIRYCDKKLLLDVLNLIEFYRSKTRVGTQVVNEDAL